MQTCSFTFLEPLSEAISNNSIVYRVHLPISQWQVHGLTYMRCYNEMLFCSSKTSSALPNEETEV